MKQSFVYRSAIAGLLFALLSPVFLGCGEAPKPSTQQQPLGTAVDVLTWHNDLALTGLNQNESVLNPANVNPVDFGQLFSYQLDGYIYAQPLYISGLDLSGAGTRDVVFVATEHDSVYALDAHDLAPGVLWQRSFIDPANGVTTVPTGDVISRDIVPEIGITGTPVIDRTAGILYVVPKTKEMVSGVAHYVQRLHALDIVTGLDILPPASIGDTTFAAGVYTNVTSVSICGRGDGSEPDDNCQDGRVVKFNALRQLNRSALTLSGDRLYIAWASHGDNRPYHGWVAVFDKNTLTLEAVFNTSPNGRWGGIWQSGAGLAVDADGNLYFSTGNGTFSRGPEDPCQYVPYPCDPAYGDSVIKLSPDAALADYFTPYNQASLEAVDQDLGSGGTMLLPDQPGDHPHLMLETGKQGRIYLIDRDDMGGYRRCGVACDDVVQTVNNGITGVHSTPAYFDGRVYYQGSGDVMKGFRLVEGRLQTPPDQTTTRFGFPGSTPSISALGTSNAIAWALQTERYRSGGASVLHAYDAVNLQTELYNSERTGLRDQAGGATKFTIPTVANGQVYVGTANRLNVFGLFPENTVPPDASPSDLEGVSPLYFQAALTWTNHATNATGIKIERSSDGETFVQVNIVPRTATSYTDSGLRGSSVYFYRIRASNQVGDSDYSNVATVRTRVQPPVLSADPCGMVVNLTWNATADGHYDIQRSADGTMFETIVTLPAGSTRYQDGPLDLGTYVYRVEAFAAAGDSSFSNSVVLTLGPVDLDHSQGFDSHAELQENGTAQFTTEGVATLNSGPGQRGSFFSTQRVGIRQFRTSFTIRLHEGTDPRSDGLTFTVQNVGPTALGPNGGGLGYGPDRIPETPTPEGSERGIRHSVAIKFDLHDNSGEGPNSTGIFTDGRSPTVRTPGLPLEFPDRSVDLRGTGIELQSQSVKRIELSYDGSELTETITDEEDPSLTFTTSYEVDIPSFVGADTAYVGFTGATGSTWSIQDILTWEFEELKDAGLPPRRPANLRILQVERYDADHSNVTVGWLCNAYTEITRFSIERSTDGVDFSEIGTVNPPSTAFVDQALGGGTYYYRARALADDSASAPSAADSILIGGGDHPTVVDYSDFADQGDLTANGNARFVASYAELTTSPSHGASGSVFFNHRLPIAAFATSFTFQISGSAPIADGMTFILQGNDPTAIGLRADGLGYEQIRNSVAIKFQIFDSEGSGPNATGIFTDGRHPSVRAPDLADDIPDVSIDLQSTGIDLHSGHVFSVDIAYEGTTLDVTITDTMTLAEASQSYPVSLPRFLGGDFAYLGFAGGTGGYSSTQDIRSWSFRSP